MKQYKIAIVENDEDERFFMKEAINASPSFELIGEFMNGDTLLEWLGQSPGALPEIILSDLNMPGKNGYDILSQVKADNACAHIPIIITSTSTVNSVRDRCLAMGAWEYLVKPDIFTDYGQYVQDLSERIKTKITLQ